MRLQCAVPTSEKVIVQLCALYFRHSAVVTKVVTVWSLNVNVNKFKKAQVNSESNSHNLESPLPLIDPHHMAIKQFLLLGLAAEYRSRRWMWSTLPPTISCLWHSRRTNLTSPKTISHWLLLKKRKKSLFEPPFLYLGVTYAPHL